MVFVLGRSTQFTDVQARGMTPDTTKWLIAIVQIIQSFLEITPIELAGDHHYSYHLTRCFQMSVNLDGSGASLRHCCIG